MKTTPIYIAWALLFLAFGAQAQFKTQKVPSKIKSVTVYRNGAQVFRQAKAQVPAGQRVLLFDNLPYNLDANSLQAGGKGNFTILSVNFLRNHLNSPAPTAKIRKLESIAENLDLRSKTLDAQDQALGEELALLEANRKLSGTNEALDINQLRQAADFYRSRINAIRLDRIKIGRKKEVLTDSVIRIRKEIGALGNTKTDPVGQAEVTVTSQNGFNSTLNLSYFVKNATWSPRYDARVSSLTDPLQLTYKADIRQNTGEDWKNVRLSVSSADPNQDGQLPAMKPWYLGAPAKIKIRGTASPQAKPRNQGRVTQRGNNIPMEGGVTIRGIITDKETNEPLIGANIVVTGTTIGVVTDINGRYELKLPSKQRVISVNYIGFITENIYVKKNVINIDLANDLQTLNEVVVVGYGTARKASRKFKRKQSFTSSVAKVSPEVMKTESVAAVRFDIEERHNIPSDNKKNTVILANNSLEAGYRHVCVPKINTNVFLTAEVTGWEKYHLLSGPMSLYYEGMYVGDSKLDTDIAQDTLRLSLGQDRGVIAKRVRAKDFTQKRVLSSGTRQTAGWDITVRNNKDVPVNLTVLDQWPVSQMADVSVKLLKAPQAEKEENTGKLKWKLKLKPAKSRKLTFAYEVKSQGKTSIPLQ
ncbi:membrane protein [Fulvitalea axinellae]|uniref:Membrane protein n=1 Tax=Fulvitalea axinellae TaxID=1182444 RepID=A0AAU9DDW4_9BACT|nr:membrane protein [Fulvitalea axinellae]